MVVYEDSFYAQGHRNIKAEHRSTLMITKEDYVTPRGDCIVAVKAEKSLRELSEDVRYGIRIAGSVVTLTLDIDGYVFRVRGYGSDKLTVDHPTDMVCRRSRYVCNRTLMIGADKAAIDIPREVVQILRRGVRILVMIRVDI
ncbi:MAG: DUF371 domain-containing protein [Nitrososphaerota archaeon]|nr:DUF371 domain-containing protein [Candidatus Bathyarchaeota archaeon]MDW8062431.1 DUF371 domain-containing protein [Nitrososphaerota archaeon]